MFQIGLFSVVDFFFFMVSLSQSAGMGLHDTADGGSLLHSLLPENRQAELLYSTSDMSQFAPHTGVAWVYDLRAFFSCAHSSGVNVICVVSF